MPDYIDGHYIYAVNNDTDKTIIVIDPVSKSLISKFYVRNFNSGITEFGDYYNIHWIAFDATADNDKGGFWIGSSYSNFFQIDRMGNILNTIVVPTDNIGEVKGVVCDNNTLKNKNPVTWHK